MQKNTFQRSTVSFFKGLTVANNFFAGMPAGQGPIIAWLILVLSSSLAFGWPVGISITIATGMALAADIFMDPYGGFGTDFERVSAGVKTFLGFSFVFIILSGALGAAISINYDNSLHHFWTGYISFPYSEVVYSVVAFLLMTVLAMAVIEGYLRLVAKMFGIELDGYRHSLRVVDFAA